ncbi:MAG: DoxX family protein [Pseudomonadota bacterium]
MRNDDLGKLLLRLTLGGLMIFHGIAKVIKGPAAINGMVAAAGFPEQLGYLVYVGELVAPLLLILGLWTRPAALVIAINMVVAVLLAHSKQLFSVNPATGAWALELQAFFLFTALAIALLGPGSLRLGRRGGFWA